MGDNSNVCSDVAFFLREVSYCKECLIRLRLSYPIRSLGIVLSFKDSPRKPLGRRPWYSLCGRKTPSLNPILLKLPFITVLYKRTEHTVHHGAPPTLSLLPSSISPPEMLNKVGQCVRRRRAEIGGQNVLNDDGGLGLFRYKKVKEFGLF